MKQKGEDEDAYEQRTSISTPGCPSSLIPPSWHHGCWGCSMQGSRRDGGRLPALGRGKASWLKPASLHPGLLLTHRRFILMRAGGPVEALASQGLYREHCSCLGSAPPGGFPGSCGSHTAAGFLFLSLLFHQFSKSLWVLLDSDAESQKFQLLPESV